MSRTFKLVLIILTAGCFLSLASAGLRAQNPPKKRGGQVAPAQATEKEVNAPRPKAAPQPTGRRRSEPPPETEGEAAEPVPEKSRTRPRAEALRVEIDPAVEKILQDWEAHSAKIQKITGHFERHKYQSVFQVESIADGKFAYQAPDKGAYEFVGREVAADAVSRKLNEKKQPYRLKADQSERWVCTGTKVLRIDEQQKTYEEVTIPAENQGENIIDGPLPFLFGMKAAQAKLRYTFELLEPRKEALKDAIWLKVTPMWPKDSVNWCEAEVIIDPKTYLPIAVRLIEPSRTTETVHYFKNLEVNAKANPLNFFKSEKDPFAPNLKKYKPVLTNKSGPVPTALPQVSGPGTRTPGNGTPKGGTATIDGAAGGGKRDVPRSADSSGGSPRRQVKRPAN